MHLVIPPIERVEIISDIKNKIYNESTHDEFPASINPIRSISRKLIPKRKNKDDELEEMVEYFMDENSNGTYKLNLEILEIYCIHVFY